ncbi:MAG: hypothetical protein COC05_06515 [Gammaproteobacteria bacterium]|nr:MAG: hypothetical protein COC05_06515 [Gammaproteobacteria bacterium]
MQEFITSSRLFVVEAALVLAIIFVMVGVIGYRKRSGKKNEAKSFVKKINSSIDKRRDQCRDFARNSVSDYVGEDEEIPAYLESSLEEHVHGILEKENSLYNDFIRLLMGEEGHTFEKFQQRVEELIQVCHFKLPQLTHDSDKSAPASDQASEASLHAELIESLRGDNEVLRDQVVKLSAENEKIMGEYEIIYEKYDALTKQRPAQAS